MTDQKINEYCRLASQQKNLALVLLIEQVLNDKKVYTFGELLGMKSIAALQNGGDDSGEVSNNQKDSFLRSFNSLELFAFGTYEDYEKDHGRYIELSKIMIKKLKQLSIISMAMEDKIIPYPKLQQKLNVKDVRALEDLIIETIYSGLISAKMNQQEQILRVQGFIGRDVRLRELPNLIQKLTSFHTTCEEQLEVSKASTNIIKEARERHVKAEKEAQKQFDAQRERVKASIKDKKNTPGKNRAGAVEMHEQVPRFPLDASAIEAMAVADDA